jgi:hypothetical protein
MPSRFVRAVTRGLLAAVVTLSVTLCSGCSPGRGSLAPEGYHQTLYGYEVRSESGSVLGSDWLLDSHQDDGREKSEGIYKTSYEIDWQDTGRYSPEEQLTYDLRFRHRATNAVVWLTTFPVSTTLAETKLNVQMHDLVDRMAGGRFEIAELKPESVVREARFATKIVAEGPATLAGKEAKVATIDIANLDQLKLDVNHRQERVRIVLARTPFKHHVAAHKRELPVYMIAGYASEPAEFDAQAPALETLLGRIVIQGQQGYAPIRTVAAPAGDAPAPSH